MYKAILVGTDGSETARVAVEHAATLAESFGSTLHVVSAYRPPSVAVALAPEAMAAFAAVNADEEARANVEEQLRSIAKRLEERGIHVVTHPVAGAAADAILDAATRLSADLIVVGSKGMSGARRVLGSVPNSVTHHAPCTVTVVRTTG